MGKTILPKTLIGEVTKLHNQGLSSMEIFDSVQEEAEKYVASEAQLARCISRITGRATSKKEELDATSKKVKSIPLPKPFDSAKYKGQISSLNERTALKEIEQSCFPIAIDILENYEGFRDVKPANYSSDFSNPPFDFFGYKKGEPFLIEFKGSLFHFHSPGETQKRKLLELCKKIEGIHLALLQVRLKKSDYRIFLKEEMDLFFDGPQRDMNAVANWIKKQLKK
jgi:hypothetical protein